MGDVTLQDRAIEVAMCQRQALDRLREERDQAERKALEALGRYKFAMFGYWAGIWVHLNKVIGDRRPNPFRHIVQAARLEPAFVSSVLQDPEE